VSDNRSSTQPRTSNPEHRAFLSLGSNLGDRRAVLDEALVRLEASGSIRVVRRSALYDTAPVAKTDQPRFLNLVAELETDLSPGALLDATLTVEESLGRTRGVRWGPRTLDIDILLYDDLSMQTDRLVLPHPEMMHRRFVLEPLVEIAPGLILPDGRPARALLAAVPDQDVRRVEDA